MKCVAVLRGRLATVQKVLFSKKRILFCFVLFCCKQAKKRPLLQQVRQYKNEYVFFLSFFQNTALGSGGRGRGASRRDSLAGRGRGSNPGSTTQSPRLEDEVREIVLCVVESKRDGLFVRFVSKEVI
jgi:hypothetical protein